MLRGLPVPSLLPLLANLAVMLTQDNNLCSSYILVVLLGLAGDWGRGEVRVVFTQTM